MPWGLWHPEHNTSCYSKRKSSEKQESSINRVEGKELKGLKIAQYMEYYGLVERVGYRNNHKFVSRMLQI